jgi:hypothetical protein
LDARWQMPTGEGARAKLLASSTETAFILGQESLVHKLQQKEACCPLNVPLIRAWGAFRDLPIASVLGEELFSSFL